LGPWDTVAIPVRRRTRECHVPLRSVFPVDQDTSRRRVFYLLLFYVSDRNSAEPTFRGSCGGGFVLKGFHFETRPTLQAAEMSLS
jgi:hypothetical protein